MLRQTIVVLPKEYVNPEIKNKKMKVPFFCSFLEPVYYHFRHNLYFAAQLVFRKIFSILTKSVDGKKPSTTTKNQKFRIGTT